MSVWSSEGTGRLLRFRFSPVYRRRGFFYLPRRDVLARFNSTSRDPTDDPESSLPQYRQESHRSDNTFRSYVVDRRWRDKRKTVTLDVDSLGKPGEIVLVPDSKRRRRQNNAPAKTETLEAVNDDTLLPVFVEELEAEEEWLNDPDIDEKMEGFRSPHHPGDKLNAAGWEDLRSRIEMAFTYQQLSDYVSEHAPKESIFSADTGVWYPGKSAFLEIGSRSSAHLANRVAVMQGLKKKQVLVEAVLRDCWQLGVANEVGQLDMVLPEPLISLFISKSFYLEDLANLHGAKIDISRNLKLIRITGTERSCESIREVIEDTRGRIREEDITLLPPGVTPSQNLRRDIRRGLLNWVNQTYGIFVTHEHLHTPMKIYYFAEDQKQAEDARRTLNLAINERLAKRIRLFTHMPFSRALDVYKVDAGDGISWLGRKDQWFRWAMPAQQTGDTHFLESQQSRHSGDLWNFLKIRSASSKGSFDLQENLTAAVGRCLFMRGPSNKTSFKISELEEIIKGKAFTTDIPRITPFLRLLRPFPSRAFEQSHLIQLVPSSAYITILPRLEFEVTVTRTKSLAGSSADVKLRSAKAIFGGRNIYYLLPECGLDLRFTRNVYRDLISTNNNNFSTSKGADTFMAAVNNCLQDLFSKYEGSGTEGLPAFCRIPVPKSLFRPQKEVPREEKDGNDVVLVEYIIPPFKDLRDSRIDHYDFYGERLSYRHYETGPFLPERGTDLFLSMDLPDVGDVQPTTSTDSSEPASALAGEAGPLEDTLRAEFNSFCRTAYRLALEVDKAG